MSRPLDLAAVQIAQGVYEYPIAFINGKKVQAAGNTVPTDGSAGYMPGCTFQHLDGGDGTSFYVNEGTVASCDFNAVNP
jgi:hypothetical protein